MAKSHRKCTISVDTTTGDVSAVMDHPDDLALRDYVKEAIKQFTGTAIVNCQSTWWGYEPSLGAFLQGRYMEKAVSHYLSYVEVTKRRTKPDGTTITYNVPLDVSRGRIKAVEGMLESGEADDDFFNSNQPGVGHGVAFSSKSPFGNCSVVVEIQNRVARLSRRGHAAHCRLRNFVRGDYDPAAKTPLFDQFLEDVFDGAVDKNERIRVIWEWLGVALSGYATALGQALILYGPAGCGKSKLSEIISACWPDTLRSSVTPHQLAENRFSASGLRAVNAVGEIPSGALNVAEMWKEAVTGGLMSVERKYKDAFPWKPYAAWVMACNTLPTVLDPSDGFTRRVLIVPMQRRFTDTNTDDQTVAKRIIDAEIPQIVSRALTMALGALSVNRIAACPSGAEILKEWRIGDNAMMAWLNSPDVKPRTGTHSTASALFEHYKKFCLDTGSEAGAQKKFSMRLRDQGFAPVRRKSGIYYDIQIPGAKPLNDADDLESDEVPVDNVALNNVLKRMLAPNPKSVV